MASFHHTSIQTKKSAMAELAFGLSKTVVEALALKVKDAISLEVEQWRTVGRELEFIVGEFEIMQSFFKIADEERAKSNLVITWVTQLRNLSYDLEDCIEFVLHLDTKNTWYLRFLPHCAGKVVLPVDEAVDQVKQLKARVLDMSERNMRYRVINESGSKLDARMQEPSAASATEFDILFKARNAVKEQSGFWDLTGLINGKDADLQVISLCGTGGDLGMSSIIKKAYDNPKICKRFKLRAWVKLMHPFNPHDFIQGLENEFFINSCGTQGEAEGVDFLKMKANEDDSDLLDKFHTKVKEHKYLIVLEDLSSMVEWHNVRTYLPDMKNGSRIVVSTRQLEIASLCIGQHYQVLELRQFSADHSVFVFLKEDFRLEDMNERNAREVRNWLDTFLHVGCNSEADKLDSDITLTRNNVKPPMVSSFCGFAAVKNSNIVKIAYRRHMLKETFDKYAWVNVSCPFNLKDFSWHLLSSLNPESLRNEDPVEECWKLLHKYHCLVVIVGMQSKECWDMIKANLTSGTYRSCIFVITEKESVATHCAASEDATYNIKDFPIEKGIKSDDMSDGGGPSLKMEELRDWANKFLQVGCHSEEDNPLQKKISEEDKLDSKITLTRYCSKHHIISSLSEFGATESDLVKTVYNRHMLMKTFDKYTWVNVSSPFNQDDFVETLLSDLNSEPLQRPIFVSIPECQYLLREYHCFVVICDLQSFKKYSQVLEFIKGSLLTSGPYRSCIVTITGEESAVTHNTGAEDAMSSIEGRTVKTEGFQCDDHANGRGDPSIWETACHWEYNFVLVGRDLELRKLDHQITGTRHSKTSHVVCVLGLPGVGKSALVRTVFYRVVLRKTFDKYVWVNVSHPLSITDFCRRVLVHMHSESFKVEEPIEECRKLLHNFHCLVVVDGLRSKEDWDLINGISVHSSSCIVVITREESVANHCTPSDAVCNIEGLEHDAALDLFQTELEKAGVHQQRDMTKLKHILYKCGGLPEVIVALARHMADLREDTWEWEWMRLNDNFMHLLQTKSELGSIGSLFTWIHSKIRGCPQPVKKCMFYLSIFPQNSIIRRRRLVRRWIAEGFSEPTDSKSLEDYMEELFHKLAALGMVQRPPQTNTMAGAKRMSFFQVSGFFREYVISRPREEKVFFPVEVTVLDEGHRLTTERVGQHIAIGENWERDRIVFDGMNFERLRSLTVFGDWTPFFISEKMRVLRVLDLENASGSVTNKDLEVMVALLPRLKFLSLRGCKEITHLPSSLGTLRQLQTLDIRHTSVEYLPVSILRLKRLNYIRAGTMHSAGYNGGVDLPRIEQMTALHTLGVVNVIYHYGLRRLTQLHKLGVSGISQKNSRQLLSAISGHNHLESLSLVLAKDNHVVSWDGINYPKNLRSLKLYGHVQMLPPQIKELRNLEKLSLEIISFTEEDIKVLGKLENLQILRLFVKMFDNGQLQFPIMGDDFPQLKVLEIDCNSNLHICFPQRTVRNLEVLKVCYHSGSPLQLSGLDHMISLKKVWLKGPSDGALLDSVRQQLDRNPKKPVFVPVE
ncbi:hypothetical protein SETIT_3G347000v2 [Setaria italica]|uniref:NB-ARC domain-containing protein n=2 Tax=Setaria italica TaxID=4555 RepID=A0A368QM04_SETIT|nr:hypothetical protein SETIT_3G347000v2 [Setaria italica]